MAIMSIVRSIVPGAATTIMDLIARLNREQDLTVVLVSHHLRLVRSLVHSVVWIEDGGARKGATDLMLAPERIMELFGPLRDTE